MVNKKSLFFALALITILSASYTAQNTDVYVLNINYNKGNLSLINIHLEQGYMPDMEQPETGYRCEVISLSDEVLYSFRFVIPNTVSPPPPRPGEEPTGAIYLDNVNFTLILPYFEEGKLINIYDPKDTLLFSIDISEFARPKPPVTSTTLETIEDRRYPDYLSYAAILLVLAVIVFLVYTKRI